MENYYKLQISSHIKRVVISNIPNLEIQYVTGSVAQEHILLLVNGTEVVLEDGGSSTTVEAIGIVYRFTPIEIVGRRHKYVLFSIGRAIPTHPVGENFELRLPIAPENDLVWHFTGSSGITIIDETIDTNKYNPHQTFVLRGTKPGSQTLIGRYAPRHHENEGVPKIFRFDIV